MSYCLGRGTAGALRHVQQGKTWRTLHAAQQLPPRLLQPLPTTTNAINSLFASTLGPIAAVALHPPPADRGQFLLPDSVMATASGLWRSLTTKMQAESRDHRDLQMGVWCPVTHILPLPARGESPHSCPTPQRWEDPVACGQQDSLKDLAPPSPLAQSSPPSTPPAMTVRPPIRPRQDFSADIGPVPQVLECPRCLSTPGP